MLRDVAKKRRVAAIRVRASQDMAKHFEMTQKMDAINGTLGALDKTSLEQRQLLLSVLVHAADISHVVPIHPRRPCSRRRTRAHACAACGCRTDAAL